MDSGGIHFLVIHPFLQQVACTRIINRSDLEVGHLIYINLFFHTNKVQRNKDKISTLNSNKFVHLLFGDCQV